MTTHEEKRREIGWDIELDDDAPPELRELVERMTRPAPRGVRWLDRFLTRRAVHGIWMSRARVDKDPAKLRALRRSFWIRIVAAAACWVMLVFDSFFDDLFVPSVVRGGIYGVALASIVMWTLNESQVYLRGWRDGRMAMRDSAREAWARGMTITEWWDREQRRDWGTG